MLRDGRDLRPAISAAGLSALPRDSAAIRKYASLNSAFAQHLTHVIDGVLFLVGHQQAVDACRRDDGELRHVDRMRALAKDRALRPFLSACLEERGSVFDTASTIAPNACPYMSSRPSRAKM
jgi:hypothetical protein